LFLMGLLVFRFGKIEKEDMKLRQVAALFALSLAIISANIGLAETDRPQLLTRGYDRNYIVKYLCMYNYTIYDAVQSTNGSTQRGRASRYDSTAIPSVTGCNYAEPHPA